MFATDKKKGFNQESKGRKLLEGKVRQLSTIDKGKGCNKENKEQGSGNG